MTERVDLNVCLVNNNSLFFTSIACKTILMCVIFISYGFTVGYKLIVLANRDEFLDRATEPAHFWKEHPNILAG
jgi:hypothetical protein